MARETIIEQQTLDFAYDENVGVFCCHRSSGFLFLADGESYIVEWDGQEYPCTAVTVALDNTVQALGNVDALAGGNNGMPFVICSNPETGGTSIMVLDQEAAHTVAIYQEVADEVPTVPGVDILLRDRNGNEIAYPGVNYIKVPTVDGGAQGYAAYDPETLKPENLMDGVTVGGVVGTRVIPEPVPVTVEPDFSEGDMVVTPDAGKVFSGVTVTKPENLRPEIIAKDEVVAGIVGALEGGGGGGFPCVFIRYYSLARKVSKSGSVANNVSITLPANSVILGIYGGVHGTGSSSSTSEVTAYRRNTDTSHDAVIYPSVSNPTENTKELTFAQSYSSYSYKLMLNLAIVLFSLPGLFLVANDDGTVDICADSNATELPNSSAIIFNKTGIRKIDLSKSNITKIPGYFIYFIQVGEIAFPAGLTSIEGYSLRVLSGVPTVLDFSLATSVPTLNSTAISASSELQIKVPAALYDEWIAATNWSALADYTVAK